VASIEGDAVFQVPRRFLLEHTWDKQRAWNYLNKRGKTGILGSEHGADLTLVFDGGELQEYLIQFVANLDPNRGPASPTLMKWPQYTLPTKATIVFQDKEPRSRIDNDTFRGAQMDFLRDLELKYPL